MDRLNQLRGAAGGSGDSSVESSPGSEAYLTANDSSKYFSLDDSSLDLTPIKDVSLSSAADSTGTISASDQFPGLSPIGKKSDLLDSYKIGKQIEAANILSGGVDIFDDDNDTSCDGNELIIDDNVGDFDEKSPVEEAEKVDGSSVDSTLVEAEPIPSRETEISLQIDGKNVDAIDIGNGLYLYRKGEHQEELAAVQIIDSDQQQPSFKFLKVRENLEGNLEVYEEIEVEVSKTAPKSKSQAAKNSASQAPATHEVATEASEQKTENKTSSPPKNTNSIDPQPGCSKTENPKSQDVKTDVKTITTEAKISPLIGFTSTPNKEGIPLTKTMVDQQLHPNRHSDNVKKTIEVNTDTCKRKLQESSILDNSESSNNKEKSVAENTCSENAVAIKDSGISCSGEGSTKISETSLEANVEIKPTDTLPTSSTMEANKLTTPPKQKPEPTKIVNDNQVAKKLDFTKTSPEKTITAEATSTTIIKEVVKVNNKPEITKINNAVSNSSNSVGDRSTVNSTEKIVAAIEENKEPTNEKTVAAKAVNEIPSNVEKTVAGIKENKVPTNEEKTVAAIKENKVTTHEDKTVAAIEENKVTTHEEKTVASIEENKVTTHEEKTVAAIEENKVTTHEEKTVAAIEENKVATKEKKTSITNEEKKATTNEVITAPKSVEKIVTINTEKTVETNEVKTVTTNVEKILTTDADNTVTTNKEKTSERNDVKTEMNAEKTATTNEDKTNAKPLEKEKKKVDQKIEANANLKLNEHILNNSECLPSSLLKEDKNATEPKSQPIEATLLTSQSSHSNINKKGNSPSKAVEPILNKTNVKELKPVAESSKRNVPVTPPKTNVEKSKLEDYEDVTESNKETDKSDETKNTSDDLIQLNDLGVVTEKEKSFEYVVPSEPTITDFVNSIPVKITKIENDTKVTTSNPNFILKIAEATKSLIAGPHKITSSTIAMFTKSEPKPVTSMPDHKTKVFENNAFVNKYVNKALLIKSVTSGPVSDNKIGTSSKSGVTSTSKDAHFVNDSKVINLLEKSAPKAAQVDTKPKSINNNNAVPFGKWTEANKQAYLNKIKETKVVTNSSNTNQIKQPYDLNRRDVLKKIDSQRQQVTNSNAARILEAQNKMNVKKETPMFVHKSTLKPEPKLPAKVEPPKPKQEITKPAPKRDVPETVTQETNDPPGSSQDKRKMQKTQDIINRTIEDILMDRKSPNEPQIEAKPIDKPRVVEKTYNRAPTKSLGLVDDIEKKMNELHGIPHERLQESRYNHDVKTYTKTKPYEYDSKSYLSSKGNKIPSLVPISKPRITNSIDLDEEEVLEHEPVTGDMELKRISPQKLARPAHSTTLVTSAAKKESGITEKDFDKFARRNSVTYNDNCIALNYDTKQQKVVEDVVLTKYTIGAATTKATYNQQLPTNLSIQNHSSKFIPIRTEEGYKTAQAKNNLKNAYNSAMTMRQKESPISVIEDKPVKVVFMDPNAEYIASRLNVQGRELSPAKKPVIPEHELAAHSYGDSLDAEVVEVVDSKSSEKSRTSQPPQKHQRKQVLTPVEIPDMEIVDPTEISSPKKKRKVDETKNSDRSSKNVLPKKNYLLGRSTAEEVREPQNLPESIPISNAASAIDNLVKAAELLETQSKNMHLNESASSQENYQTPTPVKRGRGRPRKNPLPEGTDSPQNKSAIITPQKKPRVSKPKPVSSSEDSSDDDELLVNWTMGKINENIVCPICHKLFRSENVVFKHVKHCTGPSPNRSETNTRSSRRTRNSFESNNSSQDISDSDDSLDKISETKKKSEIKKNNKTEEKKVVKNTENKKEATKPNNKATESAHKISDEVIAIEDTPIKKKLDKSEDTKQSESKPPTKGKLKQPQKTNLVCEICGKTFRQLSYLVSHKMTHKKDEPKKTENDNTASVFSCEVCKKEFRMLHHLVQHRLIHNPTTSRSRRKSSAEVLERKSELKIEDQSAGFRCEPCDKSFRKLHHLVEHRETHDGINRQKTAPAPAPVAEKTEAPPQCNICNKTFRKLHHLIEHKEQHIEASSEKSDDKSVKSSLSTRDIIHECSLCYMVFPNEHSLNKHSVNCQKKKRQSISKPSKPDEDSGDDVALSQIAEDIKEAEKPAAAKVEQKLEEAKPVEVKIAEPIKSPVVEPMAKPVEPEPAKVEEPKPKKVEPEKKQIIETIVIEDTPKKKVAPKDKVATTITKRQKSTNLELPVIEENKPTSDDDEIRYMLNPDFKSDDSSEGKTFMKVRSNKRNSLQIERPNSKNLIHRRGSLQIPPKIPRLKPKKEAIKEPVKLAKPDVPSTDSDDSEVKYSFPEVSKVPEIEPTTEKKMKRKTMSEKRKSLGGIAKRKSLGKAILPKSVIKNIPVAKPVRKRTSAAEHRCDCGQLFLSAALLARHASLAHTPPRVRRRREPPPAHTRKTLNKRKSEANDEAKDAKVEKKKDSHVEAKLIKKDEAKEKSEQSEPKTARKSEAPKATRKSVESKLTRKSEGAVEKPSRKSEQSDAKTSAKKAEIQEPKTAKKTEDTLPKAITRKSSTRSEAGKSGVNSRKSSVNIEKARDDATPSKRPRKEAKQETVTKSKSGAKLRRTATHAGVPVPDKMRRLMEKLKK